jgi:hypothetical protein
MLLPGAALATCLGDDGLSHYPNVSIEKEIRESDFIVVGKVSSRRIVVDVEDDPQGYAAELFQVEVESILSGDPDIHTIHPYPTIYSSNDTSRFPFDLGETYLLFVSDGQDGRWVNTCGNSDTYKLSQKTIEIIKKTVPQTLQEFRTAINLVRGMTRHGDLTRSASQASRHGLDVLNVSWQDTARFGGSRFGPTISDVTLQVREPADGGFRTHLLPVLRFPNFSAKTADIAAEKLWINVGNQADGAKLVSVPLTEVLSHLRDYLSVPDDVLGTGNLLADRDTHMLVGAQHVFVPIPKTGKAEFNPVIFNYQSSAGNPAVLTLLATREGTSVAVIENSGDDQSFPGGGQQLFFNNHGQRTVLTAERKSGVKARVEAGHAGALDEGAEMMLLIQVPLKFKEPRFAEADGSIDSPGRSGSGDEGGGLGAPKAMASAKAPAKGRSAVSDVENTVWGHGTDLGPVVEGHKLTLERDTRFPVRVTVQFYTATSTGVVSSDLAAVKQQIDAVYAKGDRVGSLVVPEGARHRPTAWILGKTPAAKPTPPMPVPQPVVEPEATVTAPLPSPAAPPEKSLWQRFKAWLAD